MTQLGYLDATILGVVQGLTEFLPISSSGHLALTQRLLDLDASSPELLLFNVIAHVGTLVAVVIVFIHSGRRFARKLVQELNGNYHGKRNAWRIMALAIIATLPTALIGLSFKDTIEDAFGRPLWIGFGLIVSGILLAVAGAVPRGSRGWRTFYVWQAILVGLAQSVAILPGISRSGSTICTAMFLGLRRRWAGEFSFLIALPAILGATLLKMRDTFHLPDAQYEALHWGPVWIGGVISLVVGVFALRLLLASLRRAKLHYFAPYCWILGGTVLWMAR